MSEKEKIMSKTPKFKTADGWYTMYALACGYGDTYSTDGKSYHSTDGEAVMLRYNGCTFDVFVAKRDGTTHDEIGRALWVDVLNEDGTSSGRERADWHQFDTLPEARKFFKQIKREIQGPRYWVRHESGYPDDRASYKPANSRAEVEAIQRGNDLDNPGVFVYRGGNPWTELDPIPDHYVSFGPRGGINWERGGATC